VQQRLEWFRQKQVKLNEFTHPGWEDATDYFRERDNKYDTSALRVPAVVQQHMDDDAVTPIPTTIRELLECLDIVPGISRRSQGTSLPGSTHIGLCSVKPQSDTSISGPEPAAERDTSPLVKAKPVEPVSFYPCIQSPANHHIDFGFGRRHGDGSCVSGGIDRQIVIFDVISWRKANCLPILQRVSFFLISVTKL